MSSRHFVVWNCSVVASAWGVLSVNGAGTHRVRRGKSILWLLYWKPVVNVLNLTSRIWLHTESLQDGNNDFYCPATGGDNNWKLIVLVVPTFTRNAVHRLSSCAIALWIWLAVDLSIICSEGFGGFNPALYHISQRDTQVQEMWENLLILKRTWSLFCLSLLISFCLRLAFLNSCSSLRIPGTMVPSHTSCLGLSLEVNAGICTAWCEWT